MKNISFTKIMFLSIIMFGAACQPSGKNDNSENCEEQFPDVEKWILIIDENSLSKFGPFPQSGYLNAQGDTIIPVDSYRCLSDTFEYFGLIEDIRGNRKMYGIDKAGKKLFEAVPDGEGYATIEYDGRIMIQKNGKYGYANHKGEVVIQPQYSCAENFNNGMARVSNECQKSKDEHYMWESNNWIYIDRCGNEISSRK